MLDKETREVLDRLTAPATKTRQNPVDFYKCRDVNDPTRAWSAAGVFRIAVDGAELAQDLGTGSAGWQ